MCRRSFGEAKRCQYGGDQPHRGSVFTHIVFQVRFVYLNIMIVCKQVGETPADVVIQPMVAEEKVKLFFNQVYASDDLNKVSTIFHTSTLKIFLKTKYQNVHTEVTINPTELLSSHI